MFNVDDLFQNPLFAMGAGMFGGGPNAMAQGMQLAQQTVQNKNLNKHRQEQMALERETHGASMDMARQRLAHDQSRMGIEQERLNLDRDEQAYMKEYREAQAETSRRNAEKFAEQVEAMKRAEERKARGELFMQQLLPQMISGQGGVPGMPAPNAPAPVGPMTTPPDAPTDRHGTPKFILDNLEKVESGGNPLAIGPDIGGGVRAKGPFQFLDSTRKMLESEIGAFDPFKPQEARDAAGYYLQKLYKEHGNDWSKALAAYGGFKTKDPRPYINKVMGGSPEQTSRQHVQNQANPGMVTPTGPAWMPKFNIKDGEVSVDIAPSFEPQKISQAERALQLQGAEEVRKQQQHAAEYGPGGLKAREAARADIKTGVEVKKSQIDEAEATRTATAEAQKATEAKTKAWSGLATMNANLDNFGKKINDLNKSPGFNRIFGLVGALPDVPGQPGADSRALHTSITKQLAKEALQSIREGSPTGGALGNVSDKDIELLETAIQNLGKAQSPEAARRAIEDANQHMLTIRNDRLEAYEKNYGESMLKGLPAGTRIGGFDKKTGKPYYRTPDGKLVIEK